MAKNLYEIFDEFEKSVNRYDKICVLRFNNSYALQCVLRGTFDPRIKYVIDEIPEYRKLDAPPGMGYSSIALELDRIYILEKDHPKVAAGLPQKRKIQIFTQMLESLEPREAEILAGMVMKRLPVKGLTYKLVQEAFPDLLPDVD